MNIYWKTEPCGEYSLGTLDNEIQVDLKNNYGNDDALIEMEFMQQSFEYDSICHVNGVALESLEDGFYYHEENTIQTPKNNGLYLFRSAPTKMSTEFDIDVDEDDFDPKKLKINYTSINLPQISDSYGDIEIEIITSVEYDGKDYTDDMNDNFVDRGYDEEITVFQVINGELNVIFMSNSDGVEWFNEIK